MSDRNDLTLIRIKCSLCGAMNEYAKSSFSYPESCTNCNAAIMTYEEYEEYRYRAHTAPMKMSKALDAKLEPIRALGRKTRTPNKHSEKDSTLEELSKDSPTFSSNGDSFLPTTMDDLDDF